MSVTKKRIPPIVIEGTRIVFPNFSGNKTKFNKNGKREFNIILPKETALQMKEDGFNIKQFKARPEDTEEPEYYTKVTIGENGRPPTMVLINQKGRTTIEPDACEVFDYVRVASADLIINAFYWEMDDNSGYAAYLQSLYVTIEEDELALKYADVPDLDEPAFGEGNNGLGVVDEDVPF